MNETEKLVSDYFKIPFGSLGYDDYTILDTLKDSLNLFSFKFLYFYFKMSKYSYINFARFKSLKHLKKYFFTYKILNCMKFNQIWKEQKFEKCFNVAKYWGNGWHHPTITKVITRERNRV